MYHDTLFWRIWDKNIQIYWLIVWICLLFYLQILTNCLLFITNSYLKIIIEITHNNYYTLLILFVLYALGLEIVIKKYKVYKNLHLYRTIAMTYFVPAFAYFVILFFWIFVERITIATLVSFVLLCCICIILILLIANPFYMQLILAEYSLITGYYEMAYAQNWWYKYHMSRHPFVMISLLIISAICFKPGIILISIWVCISHSFNIYLNLKDANVLYTKDFISDMLALYIDKTFEKCSDNIEIKQERTNEIEKNWIRAINLLQIWRITTLFFKVSLCFWIFLRISNFFF